MYNKLCTLISYFIGKYSSALYSKIKCDIFKIKIFARISFISFIWDAGGVGSLLIVYGACIKLRNGNVHAAIGANWIAAEFMQFITNPWHMQFPISGRRRLVYYVHTHPQMPIYFRRSRRLAVRLLPPFPRSAIMLLLACQIGISSSSTSTSSVSYHWQSGKACMNVLLYCCWSELKMLVTTLYEAIEFHVDLCNRWKLFGDWFI